MPIDDLADEWEALAKQDAFDAVLTDPSGERHWNVDAFFARGHIDLEWMFLTPSREFGLPLRRGDALDFGCGLGRVTQAIADHFENVVGVDVAHAMIERARGYNRHGDRVRYVVNVSPDLSVFPDGSFDFILSTLVLQHMEPTLSAGYIAEFVRLCAPGGLIYFQVPDSLVEVTPLPPQACKARIDLVDVPSRVVAGTGFDVTLTLRNKSRRPWPGPPDMIGVGNHWLDADGNMVIHDDARKHLSEGLGARRSVELVLACRAPDTPGVYHLELEPIQEQVRWFTEVDPGCAARARLKVVGADDAPSSEEPQVRKGKMSLWPLPRAEVESIIASHGARMLREMEAPRCGPAWVSFEYWATVPG